MDFRLVQKLKEADIFHGATEDEVHGRLADRDQLHIKIGNEIEYVIWGWMENNVDLLKKISPQEFEEIMEFVGNVQLFNQ
jgi:hypothetical protein